MDVANYVEFLHNVRNLKIRGARGYVGTSNIIWNSLPFGLNLCKNITALWVGFALLTVILNIKLSFLIFLARTVSQ